MCSPECVACTDCNKKLTGGFHSGGNNLYCDNCYAVKIAPKCEQCKQALVSGKKGTIISIYKKAPT
jgi:hypothetical protein